MSDVVDLSAQGLIDEATRKTGLSDFGDDAFRPALAALVAFYEARLQPRRKKAERRRLLTLLENRLRVAEALRKHPSIRQRPIRKPVFLTGLPRTGTSALFNLLAADPTCRPLLLWEGNHPDPLDGVPPGAEDPRLVALRAGLERARQQNPEFAKIHDARADQPEECVQLLAHSMGFVQMGVEPIFEPYRGHFDREDRGPAYRLYADLLRLLDFQRPGERWLLKTPAHLWALEHLLDLFPDAGIVVTHRNPLECVPSYCSMIQALMQSYEPVDPAELGPAVLDYLARSMDHAMAARDRLPAGRFVDVRYVDFLADPLGVARRVHEAFALPFDGAARDAMEAHARANPQNKHGKHAYGLEKFGLTRESVLAKLGAYVERYQVPLG